MIITTAEIANRELYRQVCCVPANILLGNGLKRVRRDSIYAYNGGGCCSSHVVVVWAGTRAALDSFLENKLSHGKTILVTSIIL